jgi:hypothetical protein
VNGDVNDAGRKQLYDHCIKERKGLSHPLIYYSFTPGSMPRDPGLFTVRHALQNFLFDANKQAPVPFQAFNSLAIMHDQVELKNYFYWIHGYTQCLIRQDVSLLRKAAYRKLKIDYAIKVDKGRDIALAATKLFKKHLNAVLDKILTSLTQFDFRPLLVQAGIHNIWNTTNLFFRVGLFHCQRYPMGPELSEEELNFSLSLAAQFLNLTVLDEAAPSAKYEDNMI